MNKTTSGEITNLLTRPFGDAESTRPAFKNINVTNNQKKKSNAFTMIGSVLATAAVLAAATFLVLKNSEIQAHPDSLLLNVGAGTTNNPFNTTEFHGQSHGVQVIKLQRDKTATLTQGNLEVGGNTFIENVGVNAQLLNYQTARLQVFDWDHPDDRYEVPSQFNGEDINKDFSNGLLFNHLGVSFTPSGRFEFGIFDRDNNDRQYVTSAGEPFVASNYYLEMGFKLETTRVFGLGERTRDFQLQDGTYTLFPQKNPGVIDDGQPGATPKQQSGMHPFLMVQLRNESRGFFGIYLRNSNAQQVTLTSTQEQETVDGQIVTRYYTHVDFKTNGGILDFFFFLGPAYNDVLQQYHNIIGKPALPPHFSQGLFISNDKMYASQDNIIILVETLKQAAFPFDGIVVSPDLVKDQHTFSLKEGGISLWHQIFPEVKWIFPYTPIVDKSNADALQKKWPGVLVTYDGNLVEVSIGDQKGFCFDYFNPNTHKILAQLTETFKPEYTGLWLYNTQPYVTSTNYTNNPPQNDPFSAIPFLNDKDAIFKNTLPLYAEHQINATKKGKHFNLHGVHGTQMAYQWQEFLRHPEYNSIGSFLLSDSTFPGAGSRGIGHIFPKTALSAQSMKYDAAQILNFNMFGMPITGHNICGFTRDDSFPSTKELCVRSYQLAFVTPLAVYNSDAIDLVPYTDDKQVASQVASNLQVRLALLTYQRTQLYKISKRGGALNRPLFAEFPDSAFYTPNMVDTIMYGDALKVDFVFDLGVYTKAVLLPVGSYWLNIVDFTIVAPAQGEFQVTLSAPTTHPIVLQKAGTIIPMQDPLRDGRRGLEGLLTIPLTISALLDQDKNARGHVLIEDLEGKKEFYELRINHNMLSFKQQNEGQVDTNIGMKQIKRINVAAKALTFASSYQACAVWNDHVSVQGLDAAVDTENDQLTLTPLKGETLNIDKLLFVVWGKPSQVKCDASLLQSKVYLNVTDPSTVQYRQSFIIRQNIQSMLGELPDMLVTVSIQDDNSARLEWFPSVASASQESEGKDRKAYTRSSKVGASFYQIKDVITISYDPFFLEIHDPTDSTRVFFSTKAAGALFGNDFSMFTFYNPLSNPDRFFGIGERKGNFWLQDNYQYSLFTNNHDLPDYKQANGRTVQFCKNGFLPIIYNQIADSKDGLMAIWLTEGSKDIFYTRAVKIGGKTVPKVSFVQTVNHIDITILFDLQPEQLFRDAFKADYKAGVQIPPTYALGQYHLVRNLDSTDNFVKIWNNYQAYGWPLEGFVLDQNFTGFQSLDFNQDFIAGNIDFLIQYLNQTNQTLIQIVKAGIPKRSNAGKSIVNAGAAIVRQPFYLQKPPALTGLDQGGEVIYANYFKKNSVLTSYIDDLFTSFETKYQIPRYGVQLYHNEIYDVYCNQDCINEHHYDPQPNQFYKVGVDEQLRNSLTASSVKNEDQHNGYGFKQQQYFQTQDSAQKKFYVSSSNTASSGRIGNVGRMINYIHLDDDASASAVALQSLSCLGLGLIGERFGSVNNEISRQSRQEHIVIQTFSPLAAHQWHDLNAKDDDIMAGGLVRYKLMLVKYTQTQLYRQAAFGNLLIRPVWVSFSTDQATYAESVIQSQYMYGDSFMVPVKYGNSPYFPQGTWCSLMYFAPLDDVKRCFTLAQGTNVSLGINGNKFFYSKEGTITPLQDPEGLIHQTKKPSSTHDLLTIPVDLHINPIVIKDQQDPTSRLFVSNGQILYYSDYSSNDLHCFVEMIHRNDTIRFQLTEGRDISECLDYPGFKVGTIVIYNVDKEAFPFTKLTINGNDADIIIGRLGGKNNAYLYFDLTMNQSKVKNLQAIEVIKFWN